jgi:pilus assembly protein CpaF
MRVETMVLMAVEMPVRAIREQVVAALDLIIQIARFAGGQRRITHVSEIVGIDPETGRALTEDIFALRSGGEAGRGEGVLQHTGYIPSFADELVTKGLLDVEVFT